MLMALAILINSAVAAHSHDVLLISARVAVCGYGATTESILPIQLTSSLHQSQVHRRHLWSRKRCLRRQSQWP